MAGYSGYSMSNNAVAAYDNGLVPASKIPGVPAALVKEFCSPSEWHHTSMHFNRTNFYDRDEVLAIFGKIAHEDYEADPDAIEALKSYRKTKAAEDVKVHENQTVEWAEWSGSRAHRVCKDKICSGCTVAVKGSTATITLPTGGTFQKRIKTTGFRFFTPPTATEIKAAAARKISEREQFLMSEDPVKLRAKTGHYQNWDTGMTADLFREYMTVDYGYLYM